MKTKALAWHGLSMSLLRQVAAKLTPVLMVSVCLLLVSGCMALFRPTTPVLHKPLPCDLSPVLNLRFPEQIDTLAGIPKTETIVENGINKLTGREHRSPDINDWFYLRRGQTEYQVIIFNNDSGSVEWYESERKPHPVFRETTENGLTGRVHYTEEPRADPEGGSVPMGYYISRADFRLHNLYIRVETKARSDQGEKPQNDKLSRAVKELGQMLSDALSSGH